MSIPFEYKFRKRTKEIRQENLIKDEEPMIVWWYAALKKNREGNQPMAVVGFRKLISDGVLSNEVINRAIPLTGLGQFRLGTVWKEGVCIKEACYSEGKFDVDFSISGWKLTSFSDAFYSGEPSPFPEKTIYKLMYPQDKSRLLEFALPNGGKLIVPCLEFFSRCYGRSAEIKRVLATYPWEETLDSNKSRLFSPLGEPEEDGKWKVKLRRRLVNPDVVLLAHAKYDEFTKAAVKRIYAEIESQFISSKNKALLFINVQPWFEGYAQIMAKGIWFNNGKSFLALQITGCSDPTGEAIQRDRENTNKTNTSAEDGGQGDAWNGVPVRNQKKSSKLFDLTSEDDPNFNAEPVEIYDDDFIIVGTPREVVDVRKEQAQNSSGIKVKGETPDNYSSGEKHGDSGKTGQASIHARLIMDSEGMLSDMWCAMLRLKDRYSNVKSVEWYTYEDGYSDNSETRLIGLKEIPDDIEGIDVSTRNWVCIDILEKSKKRGVLVSRIMIDSIPVHILEIERRPRSKNTEESLKGLVFIPPANVLLESSLNTLLDNICLVKGVVKNIVYLCPGEGASFNHSSSKGDQNLCDSALRNALRKVGFRFSTTDNNQEIIINERKLSK